MTSQGFLQIPDDAFWAPKLDPRPALRRIFATSFVGFALDAPREVDLRVRATLPAAIAVVAEYGWIRDWTFDEHTLLVASEIDRFQSLVDLADPIERPVVRGPPPAMPDDMGEGKIGESAVVDVRRRLELPWEPGVWQLVLLTRDRRSAPVRVVLRSGDSSPAPAAPVPGAKLVATASGRGLDTALDIALKVHATRSGLKANGGDVAVPVTFVVTGYSQPYPYIVHRAVPGHWGPAGEPEHVVAATRIALKELVPAGVQDSALYVWAFAGDQVSTPVRVPLP